MTTPPPSSPLTPPAGVPVTPASRNPPKPAARILRRCARISGLILLTLTLLLSSLVLFMHSAVGGSYCARWTTALVNALDTGIQLELASIELDWPLKLKIRDVSLSDAQGLWLEAAQADALISPHSLLPTPSLHWNIQISQLVVRHAVLSRLPQMPPAPTPQVPRVQPQTLTLLPQNLDLRVDEMLLEHIRIAASALDLQPAPPSIQPFYALRLKAQATLSANTATLNANAEIRQNFLTNQQDTAEQTDSTAEEAAGNTAAPLTRLNLNARFADNRLHVQTNLHDTLLLWPHLQDRLSALPAAKNDTPPTANAENVAVQGTLDAHIPSLTPSQDYPLRLQWDMQITAAPLLPAKIQGSLLLNGAGLEWDKVSLVYPAALPLPSALPLPAASLSGLKEAEASAQPHSEANIGASIKVDSAGIFDFHNGPVARLDCTLTDLALLRSFGLSLPQIDGPVSSTLRINATQQPFVQWDVHSPALRLPQGSLQESSLNLTARTAEISPPLPAQAQWSLPTSFTGTLATEVQSCVGLGPAKFSTTWALDMPLAAPPVGNTAPPKRPEERPEKYPEERQKGQEGRNLGIQLANLHASLSGLTLNGTFASSGTHISDASLKLAITDTKALARLANIPLKGCPLTFTAHLVPAPPRSSNQEAKIKGQFTFGAGSYDGIAWSSADGTVEANTQQALLQLTVKGPLAARLRCSYTFTTDTLRIDSFELSESSTKSGATLLNPTEVCFAGGLRIDNTNVALRPAGSLHLKGKLSPETLDLDAKVVDIPLLLAKAFTNTPLPHGTLSAQARLKGSPASPTGTLSLQVDNIPLAAQSGSPQASLLVEGSLSRSPVQNKSTHNLNLSAKWAHVDSLKNFAASAQIPLRFAPFPTLATDAPLRGKLFWQGEISPLWRLVPLPGRTLSGRGEVQAQLSGSLRAPVFSGHAFVGRGKFVDSLNGILLDAITLEARYGEQGQSLLRLHATDGRGGTLALDGSLSAAVSSLTGRQLALHGIINKLRPLRRDDIAVQLSGTLAVNGPVLAPFISGNICIDQGLVQLLNGFGGKNFKTLPVKDISALRSADSGKTQPQSPRPLSPAASPAGASAGAPALELPTGPHCDIAINAPGHLYIRGKGLDSEWKAQLFVKGPLDDPRILGNVTPIRGQLELLGHQFTLASGTIGFSGSTPPNPALDLTLEYKSTDITALIMLGGSAKQPKMRLSSQPVLPNDEIIAQILFGKNINTLSRFEALQAANTARQLVDLGPSALDILSSTRDILGLEVLRLGSAESSRQNRAPRDASLQGSSNANPDEQAPTIQAGKYILDNVYVGLDQGTDANAGTAVRVEVELLPNLSLEGRTSNQSTGVGINWKMDY